MRTERLRLGSLDCRISAGDPRYGSMLASVFGTSLEAVDASVPSLAEIVIDEAGDPPAVPADRLTVCRRADGFDLETDPLVARVITGSSVSRIFFTVRQPGMREDWLAFHFWLVTNRLLLILNRIVLHAAALQFCGRVYLFAGPKGAGKSTLSVALARAGAVLLAEDHILLTRAAGEYLVSGVNARMRVTEKTERHFLPGRLTMKPILVSGTPKKEFPARDLFTVRAHEDFRPDALFFNRVGRRFHAAPLSKRDALLRLMKNTADLQRFSAAPDYAEYLEFLSTLANRLPAFDLEVKDSLEDLGELVEYLRT